jgi:hypothetical protein
MQNLKVKRWDWMGWLEKCLPHINFHTEMKKGLAQIG